MFRLFVLLATLLIGLAPGEGRSATRSIRRPFGEGTLLLEGASRLTLVDSRGRRQAIDCGPLRGAWGLWVDDVDGDGQLDLVLTLRKRARFDPVLENRLHVYTLRGTGDAPPRCVPLWRGTRLAGRFDRIGDVRGGRLVALERTGRGRRRVARYRWRGFGFAVQRVLWSGSGAPPPRLLRLLDRLLPPSTRKGSP